MMNLPKEKLRSPSGQILVLFLLVLVVALSIVLLVASRTVTEIRTTTTSDESNRAYFAAEAGVEEALQKLDPASSSYCGTSCNVSLTFSAAQNVSAATQVDPIGTQPLFVYPDYVAKDGVVQVMMLNELSNLSSGWDGSVLTFRWGGTPAAAIEVSAVSYDGSAFQIVKFAFDPDTVRRVSNKFCPATSDSTTMPDGKAFEYRVDLNIENGSNCAAPTPLPGIGTNSPVLLRIRTLYNTTPIAVEIGSGETNNLPAQGSKIVSTGTTLSGVTRRLEVTRLYPAMDPFFDYVLFSQTTLSK